MKQNERTEGQQKLIREIEAKQRNIVWPAPLINSRGVDAFLWNGSPKPSMVQRAGAVVFGLFFICAAVIFASLAAERHSLLGLLGFGLLYVGARMLRNSFPRRASKQP